MVSHVAMGRDRRTYRFVKDTRNGRIVLAELPKMEPIADSVTRYVAERMVEREHLIEGDAHAAVEGVLNVRASKLMPRQNRTAAKFGQAFYPASGSCLPALASA